LQGSFALKKSLRFPDKITCNESLGEDREILLPGCNPHHQHHLHISHLLGGEIGNLRLSAAKTLNLYQHQPDPNVTNGLEVNKILWTGGEMVAG